MKNKRYLIFVKGFTSLLFFSVIFLLGVSCSPKISTKLIKNYPQTDPQQEILIITVNETEPENSEVLGTIKIGDTGFSLDCDFDIVIEKAKTEVRKAGGNALKITKHKLPSMMGSSCHRIKANILKIENVEDYLPVYEEEIIPNMEYAVIYVYRLKGGAGVLVNYDLYLGDSVICRVQNNSKEIVIVEKEQLTNLWARTEKKVSIPVNIEHGREYYLRCGVSMGAFVGHPRLELVNKQTGKLEYDSIK